jgi:type I restriction enzyme S subunit
MMEVASIFVKRPTCLFWSEVEKWTLTSSHFRFWKLPNGWRLLPVSAFASQIENKEKVNPDSEYRMVGVRGNGGGAFHRETVLGKEQSANYLYPIKPGAIIYNRLFAWKSSFAVVDEGFLGFYVSNEFPQFEIDKRIALPEYVYLLFTTNKVIGAVKAASIGSAAVSRNRFIESELLSIKVPIPPLPVQQKIVAHWEAAKFKVITDLEQARNTLKSISRLLIKALGLKKLGAAHNKRAFVSSWQEIERWGVGIAREISRRPKISNSRYPVVALVDVIANLQNGWSPKCLTRRAEEDEWGVLKVGAVSFGWFDESQNKALPPTLKPREQYD